MEITKKHWTIIGIVIGALAIYYFFIRKNKMSVESGYADDATSQDCPCPPGSWAVTGSSNSVCCGNLVKKRGATMSVESGYQRGGPTAAPKPKVCHNSEGLTCREGTPYCYCGTAV